MPRSMWKGAISFGLVNIPVKLYGATQSKDISFHLLHKDCHSRLKSIRWCPVHNRAVDWNEIVRGYEYAKDQYVVVTDEELDKLPIPSKHSIDVCAVVSAEEIDPVYYEKSYVLEPDASGTKGYALLAAALEKKALVALARITLRTKQRLCAIRVVNEALVVETLYSADEVTISKPAGMTRVKVSDREMDMALSLMDELRESFEPEKYPDEYREAITALLDSKDRSKVSSKAPAPTNVIDLMDALKASVAAAKKNRGDKPSGARTRRRKAS